MCPPRDPRSGPADEPAEYPVQSPGTEPPPDQRQTSGDNAASGSTAEKQRPRRSRMDPLSLAAITVVSLAVAFVVTLMIIEVFGTSGEDPVNVEDVLETDEGAAGAEQSFSKGSPAPDVDFPLLGGGSSSMSDFLGKPLVVNFWSSTCAPCLAEMPDFETVNQELGDRVAFLGVDVVDTEEAGLEMVEKTGITYPSARDPRGDVFAAFGGTALPRTVILDAEGTVVEAITGEMSAEELASALERAGLT